MTLSKAFGQTRRWGLLLVLSAVFTVLLELARIPAAVLLGPMIAAILMAACGGQVTLPEPLAHLAQGVIGCMIAQ